MDHLFLSFCISDNRTSVKIKAKVLQTDEEIEIVCNSLVAAEGVSLLSTRVFFLAINWGFELKANENLFI